MSPSSDLQAWSAMKRRGLCIALAVAVVSVISAEPGSPPRVVRAVGWDRGRRDSFVSPQCRRGHSAQDLSEILLRVPRHQEARSRTQHRESRRAVLDCHRRRRLGKNCGDARNRHDASARGRRAADGRGTGRHRRLDSYIPESVRNRPCRRARSRHRSTSDERRVPGTRFAI